MDPISMITYFVVRVVGSIAEKTRWRKAVDAYENEKPGLVAQKYRYSIFPIDFISVRRSQFAYDNTEPGSPGDYARTVIKVKDIYPFILSAHSGYIIPRSFHRSDPSRFDSVLLDIGMGYVQGTNGKWLPINENQIGIDHPKTPGILDFTIQNNAGGNRLAHTITEKGKAYTLAPNVEPNFLTKLEANLYKDGWKYALVIFLIIAAVNFIAVQEKK